MAGTELSKDFSSLKYLTFYYRKEEKISQTFANHGTVSHTHTKPSQQTV